MNIKMRALIRSILLTLGFAGLVAMANASEYKQFACKYAPEDRYIWIKFQNGLQEKGLAFVSDGAIFESAVLGMTYSKNYSDITKVIIENRKASPRLLSVEFTEHGKIELVEVGTIEVECWENIKELLAANPDSQHIAVVKVEREWD